VLRKKPADRLDQVFLEPCRARRHAILSSRDIPRHLSAFLYTSVITFGSVCILYRDRAKKSWFLDRLPEKHRDPSWEFEPGYPLLDQIILYEKIEIMPGKESFGLRH
jgi:hypothetical protein